MPRTQYTYVYLLSSIPHPDRHYTGQTRDLRSRLQAHNAGQVASTASHRPWRIETALAFRQAAKAIAFEKYLKSHSGRAFASKHL